MLVGNKTFPLLVSVGLYTILCFFLYQHFWYTLNSDGISYLSVAEKYLLWDSDHFINAYWAPLLSWLLAPVLTLLPDGMAAFKSLNFIIGLATLYISYRFISKFRVTSFQILLFMISLAMMVFYFSLATTPDLLLVLLCMAYMNIMIDDSYTQGRHYGLMAGTLGGLMYLTKSFGLPFFLAHFILSNLFLLMRNNHSQAAATIRFNFFSGLMASLIITIPWVMAISAKQGHFTIGESGKYNMSVMAPQSDGTPMETFGLLEPANDSAYSVWEDITTTSLHEWNIFESTDNIKHQIIYLANNIFESLQTLQDFSMLSIGILLMAFLYLVNRKKSAFDSKILIIITALALLIGGYALVFVQDRYLWMVAIMTFAIAMAMINVLKSHLQLHQFTIILMVLTLSWSFMQYPLKMTAHYINTNAFVADINQSVDSLHLKGRVASNEEWDETLLLSYLQGWKYLGLPKGRNEATQSLKQLRQYGVDHYLIWDHKQSPVVPPMGFTLVSTINIDNVSIPELMPFSRLRIYSADHLASSSTSTQSNLHKVSNSTTTP